MEDTLLQLEAIAAVDENWGLGYRGGLLARVSPDLRRFRELTWGGRVIYGRRTLRTFPGERPLPGRENVVLTHDAAFRAEGIVAVHSLEELASWLRQSREPRSFVIGGAQVYRELLPWCRAAHITRLGRSFTADCFFPDLDSSPDWYLAEQGEEQVWEGLSYSFSTYRRR